MMDTRRRILIVDDEESIRRSLRTYLEDEGFSVVAAATGEDGLETLLGNDIDGAIVDIRLPGMDGNRFMELAHDVRPGLKFLVYTGSVDYSPSPSLEALGVSARNVFSKPLEDMALLTAALADLLQTGGEDG